MIRKSIDYLGPGIQRSDFEFWERLKEKSSNLQVDDFISLLPVIVGQPVKTQGFYAS